MSNLWDVADTVEYRRKGGTPKKPDFCSLVFGHAVKNRMTVRRVLARMESYQI